MYTLFLASHRNTRESLGELEKAVETVACTRVPTTFLVLPNFHSCFYNSIEIRYMFYFLISINLLAFYHECRPLIGYATNVLFNN